MTTNKEPNQLDKFKDAAREAECDMDEKDFDKALGKLAKSDPPPENEQSEDQEPAE